MTPPFWVESIVFFFIVVVFPYLMFIVVSLGRGVKLSFVLFVVLFILPFIGGFPLPSSLESRLLDGLSDSM
jgi:hypothetical protein